MIIFNDGIGANLPMEEVGDTRSRSGATDGFGGGNRRSRLPVVATVNCILEKDAVGRWAGGVDERIGDDHLIDMTNLRGSSGIGPRLRGVEDGIGWLFHLPGMQSVLIQVEAIGPIVIPGSQIEITITIPIPPGDAVSGIAFG